MNYGQYFKILINNFCIQIFFIADFFIENNK